MAAQARLVERLQERIRSGIIFMGGAYANRLLSERFLRKYLNEYAEIGAGLGVSMGLELLGIRGKLGGYEPYIGDIIDAMSDYGFYESVLQAKIVKAPKCWAKDANTLKCINFDADVVDTTTLTVLVDDAQQTVSAITGTPASFEVSLSAPLTAGWHKIVVIAGNTKKDTFRGKVYVA